MDLFWERVPFGGSAMRRLRPRCGGCSILMNFATHLSRRLALAPGFGRVPNLACARRSARRRLFSRCENGICSRRLLALDAGGEMRLHPNAVRCGRLAVSSFSLDRRRDRWFGVSRDVRTGPDATARRRNTRLRRRRILFQPARNCLCIGSLSSAGSGIFAGGSGGLPALRRWGCPDRRRRRRTATPAVDLQRLFVTQSRGFRLRRGSSRFPFRYRQHGARTVARIGQRLVDGSGFRIRSAAKGRPEIRMAVGAGRTLAAETGEMIHQPREAPIGGSLRENIAAHARRISHRNRWRWPEARKIPERFPERNYARNRFKMGIRYLPPVSVHRKASWSA